MGVPLEWQYRGDNRAIPSCQLEWILKPCTRETRPSILRTMEFRHARLNINNSLDLPPPPHSTAPPA
jgi:hypothetical protein